MSAASSGGAVADAAGFRQLLVDCGVDEWDPPMGGKVGTDGDCIAICGMQEDSACGGARHVPGTEQVATLIARILSYLETRLEAKWCVVLARDFMPLEHVLFHDVPGRPGQARFSVAGSHGAKLHWALHTQASHLHSVTSKRFIFGFKGYHEQIASRSIFAYTHDVYTVLHKHDLDPTQHVRLNSTSKYLRFTGCMAGACPGTTVARGPRMNDLNAAPPVALLLPPIEGITPIGAQLPAAIRGYFDSVGAGKKQVRRLFLCGVPFDQDVAESALVAAMGRIVTDVYIIVDACRVLPAPDVTPRMKRLIPLLKHHGVRFCTFDDLITKPPLPVVATPVLLPAMRVPVGGFGRRPKEGSELEIGHVYTISRSEENVYAKLFFTEALAHPLAAAAEVLRQHVIDAGHHDRAYPHSASPPADGKNTRLGQCLARWAGRDSARASAWRYQTPAIELSAPFPQAVEKAALVLDEVHYGDIAALRGVGGEFGSANVFALPLDDAVAIQESLTYVTQEGALVWVRRILQEVLRPHIVAFLSMRMHVPLAAIMRLDGAATQWAVTEAERRCEEAGDDGPDDDDPCSPRGAGDPNRVRDTAECEWTADRLSEQAGVWTVDVETAAALRRAHNRVRDALADMPLSAAVEAAMAYSLGELATMGVSRQLGYLITRNGTPQVRRGPMVAFVLAAAVDFSQPHEAAALFEAGGGAWRLGARERYTKRMECLWRCVLAAFKDAGVASVSLAPLGAREVDVVDVPAARRGDVRAISYTTLLYLLAEEWGFAQVYVQVEPQQYAAVMHEVEGGGEGRAFATSVVVHVRDAKELCHVLNAEGAMGVSAADTGAPGNMSPRVKGGHTPAAGRDGATVGCLIPADAEAVALGQLGGRWEQADVLTPPHRHGYAAHEDAANTTTILLNHLGMRGARYTDERVATHPAAIPLRVALGVPRNIP